MPGDKMPPFANNLPKKVSTGLIVGGTTKLYFKKIRGWTLICGNQDN
jgi:hypothetical protein